MNKELCEDIEFINKLTLTTMKCTWECYEIEKGKWNIHFNRKGNYNGTLNFEKHANTSIMQHIFSIEEGMI